MLHQDDMRKAVTWAFLTAKAWGWTTKREDGMIWVNTGSNEIGCDGDFDFVSFMSDENKARSRKVA